MDTHLVEQEEEEAFLAEPGVSDPWIDSCCLDETVCGSAYLPRCRLHSPCTGRIHSKRTGLSLAVILQSDVYEVTNNVAELWIWFYKFIMCTSANKVTN